MQRRFPNAKTLRMDADTTTRKNAHETLLEAFGNHEADILIGTQMIAKGLDYPDVTLVGILNADAGLHHTDFRSVETTFHLIVQASGRSGRSEKKGEVLLQAFDPNHYVLETGARNDYLTFFKKEMEYRRLSQNPPYTYLISIVISHANESVVDEESTLFAGQLRRKSTFKVLGPSALHRISDRHRRRILCKGKNLAEMKQIVQEVVQDFRINKRRCTLNVDINPQRLD